MRPTAYYFGTFNPLHWGHLLIAQAALNQLNQTFTGQSWQVVLVPAGQPPNKVGQPNLLPAFLRLALIKLALHALQNPTSLAVCDLEVNRPGVSYTMDTLRVLCPEILSEEAPQQPVVLIMGADTLATLPSWKEAQRLVEVGYFLMAPRFMPSNNQPESLDSFPEGLPASLKGQGLNLPLLPISAQWLRDQKQRLSRPNTGFAELALWYGLLPYYMPGLTGLVWCGLPAEEVDGEA